MRCTSCQTYIPEGLADSAHCPACGKEQQTIMPSASPNLAADEAGAATTEKPASFADYFTITSPMSVISPAEHSDSSETTLSFGREGFSLVWSSGSEWKQIRYRDLLNTEALGKRVRFTLRDGALDVRFRHRGIQALIGRNQSCAKTLVELIGRVPRGLTPTEISLYKRKLGSR